MKNFLLSLCLLATALPAQASIIYCRNMNYDLKWEKKSYFPSPDQKYVAIGTVGDGEYLRFSLYHWDAKTRKSEGKAIFSFDPVDGFGWRPGKSHELIFGISFENWPRESGLYSWNEKLRCLVRNSGKNGNSLAGISDDGKFIVYDYLSGINAYDKTAKSSIKKLRLK